MSESESILPDALRSKLWKLFSQIEAEFEGVYAENLNLQEKVDTLTERLESLQSGKTPTSDATTPSMDQPDSSSKLSVKSKASNQLTQLIMKPKQKTGNYKKVINFKGTGGSGCQIVRHFRGHSDGVWEVSVSKGTYHTLEQHLPERTFMSLVGILDMSEFDIIETFVIQLQDRTARLWCLETGVCLLQYQGHKGSVNSIRFHATEPLVLTGSGDHTAHIWKSTIPPNPVQPSEIPQKSCPSSGDDLDGSDKDDLDGDNENTIFVKSAQCQLEGHTSVIISADWMAGGEQLITASWDRTANLYDVETTAIVHTLTGHDQELTHCCTHPSHKMAVTSSTDTTFRLWDFRDPSIHSVNVFQGHSDSVTSAAFTSNDKVVSGSDDRTVKVWDLKNMRTPIAMIRTDSPVNRLAVSPTNHVIAIPHDNRHVRLYDITGVRLGRLPKSNRQGHHRMVCGTAWADEGAQCNLFSCGFDRQVFGWHVTFQPT
ncbi:putative WD repeat-containing protein 37 [Apostichopus japonicus]|uniref:WD repeat-containing protein 37 n=1 Tax=Stichopus japonicus TaxID=307972 RepID=A0A2G8JU11_STIJA|nr:putative WD repeat-containing protein 37 [Apostichopus japonicus]